MREIKFRAWEIQEKRYRKVNAIDLKNQNFLELEDEISKSVICMPDGIFPDFFILEQYTGLKDKNDKEVYEGDIVKVKYKDLLGRECEAIGVIQMGVLWWEIDFPQFGTTVAMFEFFNDEPEDFEIFGNIHENGDLLNDTDEQTHTP
jgi:uncharacterized phage protein (TIGR01671 family)